MNECLCGCGEEVKPGNKYIHGHNGRGKSIGLGKKRSEETKKKMSEKAKGNKNALGSRRSEEVKKKISETQTGNKYALGHNQTKEHKEKIGKQSKGNTYALKTGEFYIYNRQLKHKEQSCVFGCDSLYYVMHHNPPIKESIIDWEGRLVNVCQSCHRKIHCGSLILPEGAGKSWTLTKTKELLEKIND